MRLSDPPAGPRSVLAERIRPWYTEHTVKQTEDEVLKEDVRKPGLPAEDRARNDENRAPQRKRLRLIGVLAFVLLNGVVLYFSARSDFSKRPPSMDFDLFSTRNLICLVCALGCVILAILAEAGKYVLMMRKLGERVSRRTALETMILGKYYDCITPSGAGGQPFQIYHLHAAGYTSGAKSAMPLASFITTQYAFVLLALVLFIFNSRTNSVVGIRIAAYAGLVAYSAVPTLVALSAISPALAGRIVSFFIRIGGKLRLIKDPSAAARSAEEALGRYAGSLRTIAADRTLLLALFALSLVYQASLCSIPYFVVRIFGVHLGYIQSLTLCFYVYASVTLVPTPGNAGAAEGSFYLLFDQLDTSGVFWAMLIWRFLSYYSFILIGALIHAVDALGTRKRSEGSDRS